MAVAPRKYLATYYKFFSTFNTAFVQQTVRWHNFWWRTNSTQTVPVAKSSERFAVVGVSDELKVGGGSRHSPRGFDHKVLSKNQVPHKCFEWKGKNSLLNCDTLFLTSS